MYICWKIINYLIKASRLPSHKHQLILYNCLYLNILHSKFQISADFKQLFIFEYFLNIPISQTMFYIPLIHKQIPKWNLKFAFKFKD